MIASLPMYDRPETAAANDRFWAGVRDRLRDAGIAAPDALTREGDLWDQWEAPDLLLSQTCGLPYRSRLKGTVTIVGSPDYGLESCPPGYYASYVVVRAEDMAFAPGDWPGKRLVYNEGRSQSGWAAALNHAARLGTSFGPSFASGGHRLSALALAEGRADISVIDAQTWRMIQRWDTWAAGLKVIGLTDPTPATPFITSARNTPETAAAVALALRDTVAEMSAEDRDTLSLRGIATVDEAAYLAVPTPA